MSEPGNHSEMNTDVNEFWESLRSRIMAGDCSNISENEFWELLRFRIMSGVPGSTEQLPGYCDWFEPRKYVLDGLSPRITGRMGFFSINSVAHLEFTLFLRHAVGSLDEIEWATLIPSSG